MAIWVLGSEGDFDIVDDFDPKDLRNGMVYTWGSSHAADREVQGRGMGPPRCVECWNYLMIYGEAMVMSRR